MFSITLLLANVHLLQSKQIWQVYSRSCVINVRYERIHLSLHNNMCQVFPGGAMGIVHNVIAKSIKRHFVDVLNRRRAASFEQETN